MLTSPSFILGVRDRLSRLAERAALSGRVSLPTAAAAEATATAAAAAAAATAEAAHGFSKAAGQAEG